MLAVFLLIQGVGDWQREQAAVCSPPSTPLQPYDNGIQVLAGSGEGTCPTQHVMFHSLLMRALLWMPILVLICRDQGSGEILTQNSRFINYTSMY